MMKVMILDGDDYEYSHEYGDGIDIGDDDDSDDG